MGFYILSRNELYVLLKSKVINDWKTSDEKDETFARYLLYESEYTPNSEFIQSLCETEEEKLNPFETGVYADITVDDLVNYLIKKYHKTT